MFKLASFDTVYPTDVEILAPSPEGGHTAATVKVDYRLLPSDRYQELAVKGDEALLPEIVVGWQGLEGPDGKPFPYSKENARKLATVPFVDNALMRGYHDRFNPGKN